MDAYVAEMQSHLVEKKIEAKKESGKRCKKR
jgi:hypothetical protein